MFSDYFKFHWLMKMFDTITSFFVTKQPVRVLLIGLDAVGKTTILYRLKLGEVVTTIPTIGFNVETVEYKNVSFTCWDVGGKDKIRPLWRHYFQNTNALIFCVDSNDRDRMPEAADELHRMLNEDELKHCALLVFANKQDLPGAMSVKELTDGLKLNSLRNINWHIQGSVATTGVGLFEGLDWVASTLNKTTTAKPVKTTKPVKTAKSIKTAESIYTERV